MNEHRLLRLGIVSILLVLPGAVWAQSATTGAIAGVVRDTTGAVLPGVTVEASSPALIEKLRAVVTDTQGQYKIVDLRPGTYAVTFSLTGFRAVRREGLELATGFTATVNADLQIGTLEETVTVTGASPVVDIQNVRQQAVLSHEILEALPTAKAVQGYASLVVGAVLSTSAQHDVGGNRGDSATAFGIHGNRNGDMKWTQDGMNYFSMLGNNAGQGRLFMINHMSTQEIGLQTGAMSAESETGGIQLNVVPKEGGNTFKFSSIVSYTNGDLQQSNLTDELRSRGLTAQTPIKKIYDYGVGLGGPILRDKLWFYTAHRWWGAQNTFGGAVGGFSNKTQDTWFYTPDLSRPGFNDSPQRDNNIRLTWQVAAKHKVNVTYAHQNSCTCYSMAGLGGRAPEAATNNRYNPTIVAQATWNYPASNRLLFEAGWSMPYTRLYVGPVAGVGPDDIQVTELSNGLVYKGSARGYGPKLSLSHTQRAAVSYVTGSHAFKNGVTLMVGKLDTDSAVNKSMAYTFRNGVPQSVTFFADPYRERARLQPNLGLYSQDQWTVGNMTLNLGVRFDWTRTYIPENSIAAGPFVPARHFSRINNAPNWKDVTPRLGVAYDLFGHGRTAVKASLGKYLAPQATSIAAAVNPINSTVQNATRTWNDVNGDYIPQESELGPLSNARFGQSVITTRWPDDVLIGSGKRGYNWQGTISVQHELWPGIALNVGYFRTWYGNFTVTDNLAVTPADLNPFCVTAPRNALLPGGGGEQICGLYDISPTKFGQVNNLIGFATDFGKQTEVYNGVDVTLNARFGRGGSLSGGVNTGQTVTDDCNVRPDSPQTRFCRVTLPFEGQTQVKLNGVYPMPWGLKTSVTYQNLPGIPLTASFVATNAQIAPSLGRNLGQCRGAAVCNGTVLVELLEPNTVFEKRLSQLDVRLTRVFRLVNGTVQGMFDIYNLFNNAAILSQNTRFGAAWRQPTSIMGGRLFKFGAQVDF